MSKSLVDLPDDILLKLCCEYLSDKDLCRLKQVCRQFYIVLNSYPWPWIKALSRLTNVSISQLKNATGCPSLQTIRHDPIVLSHPLRFPNDYNFRIQFDHSNLSSYILPTDPRPLSGALGRCPKRNCDVNRCMNDPYYLLSLAYKWNRCDFIKNTLVKFIYRFQTSFLQYDEHNHQLWFTCDRTLMCLNLRANRIDYSYQFNNDDVLCYKVYNDHLICIANGNLMRIICRSTQTVHMWNNNQNSQESVPSKRNDVLSLDVYSNDNDRYLIVNGSHNHTVSMSTFDISTQTHQPIWSTQVDDRVLCSRFTSDGKYILIGTGGTASLYPLVLFNSERAQPIHIYDANYRLGAGVRCIEWASPHVFIAAGFDSQYKEFDMRTGQCHYTFSDDFNNDYCSLAVSADNHQVSNGIVLGGNHHSTIRVVNRKQRQLQTVLFVSKERSPVHSLAVTPEFLFASVDRSIVALDFTRSNQLRSIDYRF